MSGDQQPRPIGELIADFERRAQAAREYRYGPSKIEIAGMVAAGLIVAAAGAFCGYEIVAGLTRAPQPLHIIIEQSREIPCPAPAKP